MIFGTMFVWLSSTTNVDILHASKTIYLHCLRSLRISTRNFQDKKQPQHCSVVPISESVRHLRFVKQNEKIRESHFLKIEHHLCSCIRIDGILLEICHEIN